MARKSNFHQKSFDDGTIEKLEVYRDYLRAWFPVFLNSPFTETIQVFDFFAGPGHDSDGNAGSPMIAVEELKLALSNTPKRHNLTIKLFFNELDPVKYQELKNNVVPLKTELGNNAEIHIDNTEFSDLFEQHMPLMTNRNVANLIFLDQYGIKEVSETIFCRMASLKHTDFIFFISSSIINRMPNHPNIAKHIPPITEEEFAIMNGNNVHRIMATAYLRWLSPEQQQRYFLGHYSIKKGANVYGLIFGSGHPLGIEKFTNIIHQRGGDANFDIDHDNIDPNAPSLFIEFDIPTRLQSFRNDLEQMIMRRELSNNLDVYVFCLRRVIKPSHGKDLLREMIKSGKLPKQKVPSISYDAWKNNKRQKLIFDLEN